MIPFARTICDCQSCTINCMTIPGFLVPGDPENLAKFAGQELYQYAEANLLASPGAVAVRLGRTFRIPTIVPARQSDGACINLGFGNHCNVHQVAPAGCRYFDEHMGVREGNQRSQYLLKLVYNCWYDDDGNTAPQNPYASVWLHLYSMSRYALPPEVGRARRDELIKQLTRK